MEPLPQTSTNPLPSPNLPAEKPPFDPNKIYPSVAQKNTESQPPVAKKQPQDEAPRIAPWGLIAIASIFIGGFLSGILSAIYYSILGVGLSSHFGVGLLLSGVLFLLGGGLIRGADIARVATVAIFGVILFIDGALLLRGASVAVHNSIKSNAPSSIQGFLTPFGVGTKLYIMASLPVVFLTIGIVYLCRPSVKRWFS